MPSEHESPREVRRLLRLSPGARTQQREQRDAGEQSICDHMRATVDVTAGSHYVYRQQDYQQARRAYVRGLEASMPRPKPPTECSARRHGEKEQCEERQYAGVFVTRSGQLDMLDHPVICGEQ
jgi:hypothetical protein